MLTPFGKTLRVFRLNRGELLKDMAERLEITPAYLSSVENGKKEPTPELMAKLYKAYDLNQEQKEEIEEARAKTIQMICIKLDNDDDADLGVLFARKLGSLSDTQRLNIKEILNRMN